MEGGALNEKDILEQYGGVSNNMLKNLLDAYEHDENEIDLILNSPYYSMDNMPEILHSKNGNFTILSLNTDGLLSKIDQIIVLLEICESQGIIIDIICIQESHLDDSYKSDTATIQINDYDCIPQGRYCGQKGGLVTYIHSKYDSSQLNLESKFELWEGLYVEVKDNESDYRMIIGNIYKPPRNNNDNRNIDRFIKELRPYLTELNKQGCDLALAGDFNINLLLINERLKFQEFFDEMTSHSLFPKITFPTRIGQQSCTLIDNVFCKLTQNTLHSNSGIIYSSISDHFPYFVSFKPYHKSQQKSTTGMIKQTKITPDTIENLKNELSAYDFSADLTGMLTNEIEDPNKNYNTLINKIIELKDKHFLTKYVKFNKHKHKKHKWITNGIIKSIKHRDKLSLSLKRTNRNNPKYNTMKQNLKTYNGVLKKSIRAAKTEHYFEVFEKYKNDLKLTWKNINELISKRSKKEIRQIKVNGTTITDKKQMAEEFNKFFANIGYKLASTIDTQN